MICLHGKSGGTEVRIESRAARGPDALHDLLRHMVKLVAFSLHEHLLFEQPALHVKQLVVLFLNLLLEVDEEVWGKVRPHVVALLLLRLIARLLLYLWGRRVNTRWLPGLLSLGGA